MAKLLYTDLGAKEQPDFNPDEFSLLSHNQHEVVYWNRDSDEKLVISGNHLNVHHEILDQGTITHWELTDRKDHSYLEISDFTLKAANIGADTIATLLTTAPSMIISGNDRIIGSAFDDRLLFGADGSDRIWGNNGADTVLGGTGNDILDGGKGIDHLDGGTGRDRMTGGAQADVFIFSAGYGKDVITDFDAVGGGYRQDYLTLSEAPTTIVKSGHDVILDFGGGDTLTLLDVRRQDLDSHDFL
jgi:hypothetical protein